VVWMSAERNNLCRCSGSIRLTSNNDRPLNHPVTDAQEAMTKGPLGGSRTERSAGLTCDVELLFVNLDQRCGPAREVDQEVVGVCQLVDAAYCRKPA
jgi:hypothetical protein